MAKSSESIKTKIMNVPLGDLKLDLSNIRYQHREEHLNDKEMESFIWGEPSTKKLYEEIKSAKGLHEEPVIDSKNIVLEGNRRVVCLRKLKEKANEGKLPGIEKGKFDIVKCKLIPEGTSDVDKQLFLASIHVRPKLQWPAFNKAKQIYDLSVVHDLSYDKLAKYLSMGKVTLIRIVNSYEETYEYGKKYPDDKFWYRKYTYFEELFKKRDLREFTKLQENRDKFSKWVHEEKFKDVRDVRVLPKILEDKDALRIFERNGIQEALKLIESKDPALKSKEFKQIKKLIETLRFFPRKELIRTASDNRRRDIILELKKEVDTLVKDIGLLDKESESQ